MGASFDSLSALEENLEGVSSDSGEDRIAEESELKKFWTASLDLLSRKLDRQIYSAWIEPLELTSFSSPSGEKEGEISLVAPNRFCVDHIERTYSDDLKLALEAAFGVSPLNVSFTVSREGQGQRPVRAIHLLPPVEPEETKKEKDSPKVVRFADESNLNPSYNFSNFVVGNCNQLAHAVSLQISESLGHAYNPFFLYGGVGLGKTHLVNAIGNAVRRRRGKVLAVSSETFVNELISAIRGNRMQQFKSKFRSLDLLIIDDVQFISGKERTQEEFFHTFNELYNRHKQIIITADKVPQELTGLEERLRTRFASGLSVDLQAPDYETRVAIVNKKAEMLTVDIPQNAAEFLAEQVETNIRELEGALNRVLALSSMRRAPISLQLCQEAIRGIIPERRLPVTMDSIQKAVAEFYSVSVTDILGKRRTQNIAFARHVAMYLCRSLTPHSFPEIGALFGGRDHTTVMHAAKVIEERLKGNTKFKGELTSIKAQLNAGGRG